MHGAYDKPGKVFEFKSLPIETWKNKNKSVYTVRQSGETVEFDVFLSWDVRTGLLSWEVQKNMKLADIHEGKFPLLTFTVEFK